MSLCGEQQSTLAFAEGLEGLPLSPAHSGAGGLSSERGRRQRSRLGAPFTDGELRLGRRTEPSTQNTTNCYCSCWYLLGASCVQDWAEYAWSFENCESLKEDGKSISLFMSL